MRENELSGLTPVSLGLWWYPLNQIENDERRSHSGMDDHPVSSWSCGVLNFLGNNLEYMLVR